jgi:hypothetical protein
MLVIDLGSAGSKCRSGGGTLEWGVTPLPSSIQERLKEANKVYVVVADIVYRHNLFETLLTTLEQLLLAGNGVKCIFATQSLRQDLDEFFARASERAGFCKSHIADVLVTQGMSDELPLVVPTVSDRKEIGMIHILELSRRESSS